MPSIERPASHLEPDQKQAVIERQAEIISDLEKSNQRLNVDAQALVAHISNYELELSRTDLLCGITTGIGTFGWVLALYYIFR